MQRIFFFFFVEQVIYLWLIWVRMVTVALCQRPGEDEAPAAPGLDRLEPRHGGGGQHQGAQQPAHHR